MTVAFRVTIAIAFGCLFFVGCEIETEREALGDFRPASTVVINEVFTLPEGHATFYCWVELLNPTADTVDLTRWTLSFRTERLTQAVTLAFDTRDPTGNTFQFRSQTVTSDGIDIYDVPFAEGETVEGIQFTPTPLPPNNLFTLVSNRGRLEDHTDFGPGPGPAPRDKAIFQGPFGTVGDTVSTNDTTAVVRFYTKLYVFALPTTGQLVLRNASGTVVDVVRYGNYVHPGPDPYPGNVSLGMITPFEAIARYAGGFYTGNTAFDFFQTLPNIRPIPHAYTQRVRLRP